MMAKASGTDGAGSGETLERRRRLRKYWIIGALFVAGFIGGFTAGFTQADDLFDPAHRWPPALAIGLTAAYLFAVCFGGWLYSRHLDEFERTAKYKAVSAAASSYVIVYPVWLLLWKGGFVPEPMHFVIFLLFTAAMLIASFFYRVR
ncbi:MAG TPA: hypothetical protein VMG08_15485 [Allosphingosinicella sp.]|nr:hypothetical protein [Allosphingosinicella sp.]